MGRVPVDEAAPPGLDDFGRPLWRRTLAALKQQNTWTASDGPTLLAYVNALSDAHAARARIREREAEVGDAAFITIGSVGQQIAHPDLATLRNAEKDAQAYADALLLTPRARARHGIRSTAPRPGGRLDAILNGSPIEGANP